MGTLQGLFFIVAIFALGAAGLAILFFGREKVRTFSRFKARPGRSGKLPYAVVGLVGLALVCVSLTGLVPVLPTIAVGAVMAWGGLGMLMPDQTADGTQPAARGYQIAARIKLSLSLACFIGLSVLVVQGAGMPGDYTWVLLLFPEILLFSAWVGFGSAGAADYVRYLELKPLPDVEPEPAVLAELLEPAGPLDAGKQAVAAPLAPAQPLAPAGAALPGLLAGVVCLSAGLWLRTTAMVSTEVGYIIGVPLFLYGIIRCGLSLLAIARSAAARRI